jgi:hypothetical protein
MSGALSGNAENLTVFAQNPVNYLNDPAQFSVDLTCTPTATLSVTPGTTCTNIPAANGSFSKTYSGWVFSLRTVGASRKD